MDFPFERARWDSNPRLLAVPSILLEGQRSIQAELRTQYALEGTGLSW